MYVIAFIKVRNERIQMCFKKISKIMQVTKFVKLLVYLYNKFHKISSVRLGFQNKKWG